MAADGSSARASRLTHRATSPAWTPNGEVACVSTIDGPSRVTLPCDGASVATDPISTSTGRSPSRRTALRVRGAANASGTSICGPWPGEADERGSSRRFPATAMRRAVAADGTLVFKVQSYRTVVAAAPAEGGPVVPLASFQSETPSWDPTGRWLGITYGTWRRVVDDAKYPDIAQDAGIIAAAGDRPRQRLRGSSTVRLRRSVAVLVAERKMDCVPFAPGSVGRHLAAAGGRRRAAGTHLVSGAAPRPAGRVGRPMDAGCCSTAPARRRDGPSFTSWRSIRRVAARPASLAS